MTVRTDTHVTADTWPAVREVWNRALGTSLAVAVATTNADGSPHVAPIGSLTLGREPGTGSLLELFSRSTGQNLDRDPRVTVLALDTSRLRFVNGLRRGRFERAVATRLTGTASPARWATEEELERFRRRVRPLRRLKGHELLWGFERCRIRDLAFDLEHPVHLGRMTSHLRT